MIPSSSASQLITSSSSNNLSYGNGSESVPVITVRDKQKDALKVMINLNTPIHNSLTPEPVWKLFIYDRCGQDIVSPLISVKELRELGVTLHMQLHSDRDSIPDVPVIYFVLPTDENIMRICQDFRNHLYDSYYLNFISPISREKLEELATVALQSNSNSNIEKVYDQYLNFVSLEDDVFTLKHSDYDAISYYAINRAGNTSEDINQIVEYITDSLFSVFVTLGLVPIIRAPKSTAAEMVAEKLNKKLRENLKDSRSSFFNRVDFTKHGTSSLMFSRPLLVIVDRSIDMATPLAHSWTYQALAHDVLDLKLNQVYIEESSPSSGDSETRKKPKRIAHDLSPSDSFWCQHKGSPFPQVAEAVQERLDVYRASEGEVKRLKSQMGLDNDIPDQTISLLTDNTSKLTDAINTLPELLETKRLIDLHTTVASAILEHIKHRKLDIFFEYEEKIISSKGHLDQKFATAPLELIRDANAGTPEDKLRLFLVLYLTSSMSESDANQYLSELRAASCDLSAFEYIKHIKSITNLSTSSASNVDSLFQSIGGGTRTVSMFSKLMSQGSQFVMEGVKNLVLKKQTLPITRVTDALMEGKSTPETDEFRYFDPKAVAKALNLYGGGGTGGEEGAVNCSSKTTFQDAIVFVVGGGNYIEYQNLVDYCKTKFKSSPKRIIYGTTELINSTRFLAQLSKLGDEMI